jgi:beta-lactamase superfamily II metal-dependent hydrolase
MLFTLEPLQAADGDCLLLHWGNEASPKLAVIDGGPGRTYEDELLPRLLEIRSNLRKARLDIDLSIVSHIDLDHIVGIKKLFSALKKEIEDSIPPNKRQISVKRLWHNTFNDIVGDKIDGYYKTFTASFQASVGGKPSQDVINNLAEDLVKRNAASPSEATDIAYDIARVLAGHGEGRKLRDDHQFLFMNNETTALNSPFRKDGTSTLITAEMTPTPASVNGLNFTILGPEEAEIKALQTSFDKYIKDNGLTAQAVLAAYADKSVANLSSIICIVQIGGKKILLAGDARGDKIIEGLRNSGQLTGNGPISFDVLKVPHHGSDNNVDLVFFKTIIADTYVFSGDGKNGNPERTTLEWLVQARAKSDKYKIVLTYSISSIDRGRKLDKKKNKKTWSQENDSLSAFFNAAKQDGYQFTVCEGAPEKIELGDEHVGY